MPRDYRRYDPDQSLLLPPSLRDLLPEDHLAFFLSDAIDSMDLSAFEARYGQELFQGTWRRRRFDVLRAKCSDAGS